MDEPELRTGEVISDALLQAIQDSKTYIVVLSENYASSPWCLDELVEIYNCYERMKRLVIVVFYNVDPSAVRQQTGSFKKAFRKHETRSKLGCFRKVSKERRVRSAAKMEKVKKWRHTLTNIAGFSGKPISAKRSEAEIINEIIEVILLQTSLRTLDVAKYPIGLDSRVKGITDLLSIDTKGVIKIGIYGMGGVGKTTLAKALYNQLLLGSFKGGCFLANVREVLETSKGLVSLQEQLINDVLKSHKKIEVNNVEEGTTFIRDRICSAKVLVTIDDIDHFKQYESLVGPFASGSVVIITTRDEEILDKIEVEPIYRYRVNQLDDVESLALFTKHAFGNAKPVSSLMVYSKDILSHAGGLPLALEVFGSNLFNQSEEGWRWFRDKLKRAPINDVTKKLMISFDALKLVDPLLQDIFIDIACFFIGCNKKDVVETLETCYTFVNHYIDILKRRCLLTINNEDELGMHDLLQEMGQKVAQNSSSDEPGRQSRLWASEDIYEVLKMDKGTEAIKAIIPSDFHRQNTHEEVSVATKAFKRMSKLRLLFLNNVNLTGSFEHIFEDLRWLFWGFCPLKHLPPEFHPQKLVALLLPYSGIRTMWEPMVDTVFEKLKTLTMSYSLHLTKTPDFARTPYLESLNLEGCENLLEVHISIGGLVRLISLNLDNCVKLKSIPDSICNLRALEVLSIGYCSSMEALPIELGNIGSLKKLNAKGLTVCELPDSIGRLSKLVKLILNYTENLEILPDTICNLRSLEVLRVSICSRREALPIELGNIQTLKELNARGLNVSNLPDSIGRLSKLVKLNLSSNLYIETLPDTFCNLRALEVLSIDNCKFLKALPVNFGNIESLTKLNAERLTILRLPDSIGRLGKLVELILSYNSNLETLPDTICNLRSLEILDITRCEKLKVLPDQLWKLSSLRALEAHGATLLKRLPEIDSSQTALSLQMLNLSETSLTALPSGISQLSKLEDICITNCRHLSSIPGLPPSVKHIRANGCTSMKRLPNLSNLKQLEVLKLRHCTGLTEIQGLKELNSIERLDLPGCNSTLLM
ncbi:TMV resistance protein N-like isoform X2 [Apium graveolens]